MSRARLLQAAQERLSYPFPDPIKGCDTFELPAVPMTFRCPFRNHQSIDFNAADTEMAVALEALPNIGSVSVTRTGPDGQLGYSWHITFVDNPGSFPVGSGDVALLTADFSSLGGDGANCAVVEDSAGSSELSGGFVLAFTSSANSGSNGGGSGGGTQYTNELAYNALAEEVREDHSVGREETEGRRVCSGMFQKAASFGIPHDCSK